MNDSTWYLSFRQDCPVFQEYCYLNSGTAGPLSHAMQRAMHAEAELETVEGRGNFAKFDRYLERHARLKSQLGVLLSAHPHEIALTHHTTEALNAALWGISFRPDDRILTTSLEHDAGILPLAALRERFSVQLDVVDIGLGESALSAITRALTEKTRALMLSHITFSTGAVLPLKEISAAAHRHNCLVIVDGAQSAGILPLNVNNLGADIYTVSAQKWLCGPEGCGALFVSERCLHQIHPTFVGYFSAETHNARGEARWWAHAGRFEQGIIHRPSLAGFESVLTRMLDDIGIERAWKRSLELAAYCTSRLVEIPEVVIKTPASMSSQLVVFDLPHYAPAHLHALTLKLADEDRVVIRSIDLPPYGLRVSLGFFNTVEDIDRFIAAFKQAQKCDPKTLPLRGKALRLPQTRN